MIPQNSIKKILKKNPNTRISQKALQQSTTLLNKICNELGQQATKYATNANRATILERDINASIEQTLNKVLKEETTCK